jgi:cell division protein FtsB
MKPKSSRKRKISIESFILYSFFSLLIAFIFFYFGTRISDALFLRKRALSELEKVEQQYEALKKEKELYEEAVSKLEKKEYIELLARKQFKMVKPGEKAYVVIFEDRINKGSQDMFDLLTEGEK